MIRYALAAAIILGPSQLCFAQGTSCATATAIFHSSTYTADTTTATNWINSLGPVLSPANDVAYTFTKTLVAPGDRIIPLSANYAFALYLLPACNESGTEPVPIGATATIGSGIGMTESGVVSGQTYYVVVTGAAPAGPAANGTLVFTFFSVPVTLQSFSID
jgi:hypothetical protein